MEEKVTTTQKKKLTHFGYDLIASVITYVQKAYPTK